MAQASGSRVIAAYVEEVTRGTTPASPTLKTIRATSRNVNLDKAILPSEEVRASRQEADERHGSNSVAGSIGYQLSLEDYDDFIRYAMGGTWAAVTTGSVTLGVDGPTQKYTRTTGSFLVDGFRVGDMVDGAGFTNGGNNASAFATRVTSVIALELVVSGAVLVTEAPAAARTVSIRGKRIDIGTNLITTTLERQFLDITKYQPNRGVAVNTWDCAFAPERTIGGTFGLLGMSAGAMAAASVSGSAAVAPTTRGFLAPFDGVLFEGTSIIAVVTSFDYQLNNQHTLQPVFGSKFSPDVYQGVAVLSGNLSAMVESEVLYNKFFNETESSIWLKANDLNGTDFINWVFPRVKYNGSNMDPQQTGPVIQNMPIKALEHSVTKTALSIQRSNV